MWSDQDDAPTEQVDKGIKNHHSSGGIGPQNLKRIDRIAKDNYQEIKDKLRKSPYDLEDGLPWYLRLSTAAFRVGLTAFDVRDIEQLKNEIVPESNRVDDETFFQYVGLKVLENGSGGGIDRII